jgi:hypothetical protein
VFDQLDQQLKKLDKQELRVSDSTSMVIPPINNGGQK